MDKKNTIINQSLATIMSDCFGRYAKYVIQDRALPDIRDGLKPVQRRILYAMGELGLFHNKQYKKSARTVGEVIGKYHPHGDSSIYEAMVRMSQDWKNNLPLLDMHGNNGSIDGDSAAAMRYTETRLSEVSTIMLDNIKKDIVEFTLNFDDTEKEPTVLPSLFPNLLINGCVGIAAGYATNIPTHNPKEVFDALIYRIKTPNSSLNTIMKIIPGPDFPTGGIINATTGLKDAFETGRGKFVISSKIELNESNSKINQIIVKEIPYDTNKSIIIKELNDIMYDEKVPGILEIRDESDKNGVSIVIDVKKDKNLELIKNYLLKNTKLQVNYSTNFVVILNKKPTIVPLLTALDSYIEFAISIIIKTAKFDLEKALKRAEILYGLIKAIKIIDKVIAVIKSSQSKEDAKNNLMKKWDFSAIQAEAIVSLQLYKLTKTDINQLEQEVDELTKTIDYLKKLINDEELQKSVLIEKLNLFKQKFGYKRKTEIQDEVQKIEIKESDMIEQKEVILGVSTDGYLKQLTRKIFESNNYNEYGLKPYDNICYFNAVQNINTLVLITRFGKCITIPIHKIKANKWKEIGQHINDFVTLEPSDKVVYANVYSEIPNNLEYVIMSKNGLVKRMNASENINFSSKSSTIWKSKDNDYLVCVEELKENIPEFISCLTKKGYGLTFSTAEIPLLSKQSTGVKSIKLLADDECLGFVLSKTLQPLALTSISEAIKFIKLSDIVIKKRYSQPVKLFKDLKQNLISFIKFSSSKINLLNDDKLNLVDLESLKNGPYLKVFIKLHDINQITDFKNIQLYNVPVIENLANADFTPYIPSNDELSEETDDSQISLFNEA